jgi:hypothetical protein
MSDVAWPNAERLTTMIEERFDFLIRDYEFVRRPTASPVVVYDMSFMLILTRIRIATDPDLRSLDVECSWPDQVISPADERPTVALVDIVAMRAPAVEVPRDLSTLTLAETTLDRSAALLREHAIDVLSGGTGLWFDLVDWKRAHGDMGEGRWWGLPIYDEIAAIAQPRTADDIKRSMEFEPIHARAHRDPEAAWSDIVAFVRRYPATAEAEMLFEDVMNDRPDEFIERIESLARTDEAVRQTLAMSAEIGGDARAVIERYNDLIVGLRGDP